MTNQPAPPKLSMRAKIVLVVIYVLFFVGADLLFGWFVLPSLEKRLFNGAHIVNSWLDPDQALTTNVQPHPYMLYTITPSWQKGENVHNTQGYRGEKEILPKQDGVVRIVTLGGSTTYGWGVENPAHAWPAVLEGVLNDSQSKKVEVINAGIPYGTSAEMLGQYMFRTQWLRPDILILHTGGNDGMPLMFPNYHPEYTHVRAHGSKPTPRPLERWVVKSHIVRAFYMVWLHRMANTIYQSEPGAGMGSLDATVSLERAKNTEPVGFYRNIETMIRMAKSQGTQVLLVPFIDNPLFTNVPPPIAHLEEVINEVIDKNKNVLTKLSQEHQLDIVYLHDTKFEGMFTDNCHLDEQGQALKAKQIAPAVLNLL